MPVAITSAESVDARVFYLMKRALGLYLLPVRSSLMSTSTILSSLRISSSIFFFCLVASD